MELTVPLPAWARVAPIWSVMSEVLSSQLCVTPFSLYYTVTRLPALPADHHRPT